MKDALEITIRNEIAEIAVVSEAVEAFCAKHEVPARARTELQVAVDEIVSNIIKYAWPDDGPHEVTVRISTFADGVRLEFRDDGVAFDPLGAAEPQQPQPGEKHRIGGLGIHMVKKMFDGVAYSRADGVNCFVLTKRCTVAASHGEE